MLVVFLTLNNITTHRLLIVCYKVLSNYYYYSTTNKFEKLLNKKNAKNNVKIATLLFLIMDIYIVPIRLLEVGPYNAKYDLKEKLCKECIGVNWNNDNEIKEVIASKNYENNDEKNF